MGIHSSVLGKDFVTHLSWVFQNQLWKWRLMITLVSFPYPLAADIHKQVSWENLNNDYLNIIWIYKDQIFSGLRTHGLEGGLVEPPVKAKSGLSQMGGW